MENEQQPTPTNNTVLPEGYQDKQKPGSGKKVLAIIGAVVAILVFVGVFASLNSKDNSTQEAVDDLLTSEEVKPYTSTEHGFKADFPGFPTASTDNLDVIGYEVPFTTYTAEQDGGEKVYLVGAAVYPGEFDFSTEETRRSSLEGSVNGSAQSIDGEIATSEFTTYGEHLAITAHIKTTKGGKAYDYYTMNFIKGNTLYQVVTIGVEKTLFDSFVASFELI